MFIKELGNKVEKIWNAFKISETALNFKSKISPESYKRLMTQFYHYTKHNAFNQATAVNRFKSDSNELLKYACKHAIEEMGHEKMIISDLKQAGLFSDDVLDESSILPETEALIGYLYFVSAQYGVKGRLGYSFWAEDCYKHITPLIQEVKEKLSLSDDAMSFFINHAVIDERHSKEVNDAIENNTSSIQDRETCTQVCVTTLTLTLNIITACFVSNK